MINNDVEDSVLLTEYDQADDQQLYKSIKEKEQQYQKVFEELSTVRSELRVVKQENAWTKTVKLGLEEEVATLKDILKQKKQIISNMGDQLQEKNRQLTEMENEINSHVENEEQLLGKLEQYEKGSGSANVEIDQLRVETDRLTDAAARESVRTPAKEKTDRHCSPMVQKQDEARMVGKLDMNIALMEGLFKKLNVSSSEMLKQSRSQDGGFQHQVETMLSLNTELVLQSERLNRQLQLRTNGISTSQGRLAELDKRTCALQLQNHQLRLQLEKARQTQKYSVERLAMLEQEYSKVMSHHDQRLEQIKKECHDYQAKYEQCKIERESYRRRTFQSLLPQLKPFLPEELIHLVRKLQEVPAEHSHPLFKEIDRLATLQSCRQKHNEKLQHNQQHTKRLMAELQGENQLLRIKLANLERAYENAVDDYRRSIRFSTANKKRQDVWSTASNKQNTLRNNWQRS